MKVIQIIIGILNAPFAWVCNRVVKRRPSAPPEFWFFIKALSEHGVAAQLQMQNLAVPGVQKSAVVSLEAPGPQQLVNLFKLDTAETARKQLLEVQSNPLMSHGTQRDRYLMSVTFLEPNEELVASVVAAFGEFRLSPNKSLQEDAASPRT
ncbi:MAG: hypothetical protein ACR2QW_13715 [bacterium]